MPADLQVKVHPKASRNAVMLDGSLIKVYTTSVPADGEANTAVIELLAKVLRVPKSSLTIIRGQTSRLKTIRIDGLTLDEALAKLG